MCQLLLAVSLGFAAVHPGAAVGGQSAGFDSVLLLAVQVGSGTQWAMSELLVDYTFWLEQGMDPTHANFLHHTCKQHVAGIDKLLPLRDAPLDYDWAAAVHRNCSSQGGLQATIEQHPLLWQLTLNAGWGTCCLVLHMLLCWASLYYYLLLTC